MTTFTIDCDNNITAFASLQEAKAADIAGAEYFGSQEELEQLAASWSPEGTRGRGSSKLLELWNSLPGVTPVKKFTDRKTAQARIWKAAQALTPPGAPQGVPDAPKAKGSKKKGTAAKKAAPARKGAKKAGKGGKGARDGSKKAEVLELMRRPKGATLAGPELRPAKPFISWFSVCGTVGARPSLSQSLAAARPPGRDGAGAGAACR